MIFAPRQLARWTWALAILLLVAEFLVFDRMTSRYHTKVYPRWTDQVFYLGDAYAAGRQLQAEGFWTAEVAALTGPAIQGTLHKVAAVFVFWLTGSPSRSAALSLNMLAFLAWQAALLVATTRLSGSRLLGWFAFSVVLAVAWPWSVDAGSAVDFRLDHAAMCLLGVAACAGLMTEGFRSLRWSLLFGLAASVTVLERFLSVVYFAGIFAGLAGWIACGDSRGLRWRNLLLAGLVLALLAGPILWSNRANLYGYYWVGHMASADADARSPHLGLWPSLVFVLGNLASLQLGNWFGWLVGTAGAALALSAVQSPRIDPPKANRDWLVLGLIFFVVPAAVLCLHRQKSAYVLGILVPGLILLILWLWTYWWRRTDFAGAEVRATPALVAVLILGGSAGFFLQRQLTSPHTAEFSAGAARVNRVADQLFASSRRAGLTQPRIGVDLQVDYFIGQTMTVLCYERHQVWLPFETKLPTGIIEEKDDFIMERLRECDFVLLTDVFPENGYYPFDRQMRRLYPEVKKWSEMHLRHMASFPIFNRQMSLYQRTGIPLSPVTP